MMEYYLVKMTTYYFNDYIHRVVKRGEVNKVLQRYNKNELVSLLGKMEQGLERWRDKEHMYPADWEHFIAAIKNRIKSTEQ
jgi:hypothetical protein